MAGADGAAMGVLPLPALGVIPYGQAPFSRL